MRTKGQDALLTFLTSSALLPQMPSYLTSAIKYVHAAAFSSLQVSRQSVCRQIVHLNRFNFRSCHRPRC